MQLVTGAIEGVQQDTGVLDHTVENMLEVAQNGRNYAADIKEKPVNESDSGGEQAGGNPCHEGD